MIFPPSQFPDFVVFNAGNILSVVGLDDKEGCCFLFQPSSKHWSIEADFEVMSEVGKFKCGSDRVDCVLVEVRVGFSIKGRGFSLCCFEDALVAFRAFFAHSL